MTSISTASSTPSNVQPVVQKNLTPLQIKVVTKLREATNKITKEVITALIASKTMSINAFIEINVSKKTNSLSNLDLRTQKFSQKLLAVVDEDLNKIPTLPQSFDLLASYVKDSTIRQKLITGIALPSIKELIENFDSIKPSIIDDINAYYHDDKPSWNARLPKLIKIKLPYAETLKKAAYITASAIIILGCLYWQSNYAIKPLPYELNAAKKIRSDLKDIFIKGYERPADFEGEEITRKLSCEKRTYTYETNIHVPYNSKELSKESNDFLVKLDNLINRECCFHITCNNTRYKSLSDIVMELKIESPCKVGIS
jgi:hypothetical protein